MRQWSIAGVIALLTAAPAIADTLTLAADAGLGGVSKPGRWTPIRIVVDNTGADFSGELLVSWGDFDVHRDVSLPSPSRKRYELFVRTGDVEAAIKVRLTSNGAEVSSAAVPVRLAAPDERITLCVAPPGDPGMLRQEGCAAITTPDALPRSARGYDAMDAVVWAAGERAMSREQRTALDRWKSLRALEDSGDLDVTPKAQQPLLPRGVPAATRQAFSVFAAVYVCGLVTIGALFATRRRRTSLVYAALMSLIGAASATALAIGRVGPASDIVVHHSTVVRQLPGEGGSMVSTRGVAEFPEFDSYALRAPIDDGFIQASAVSGRQEQVVDDAGQPQLRGSFALAARRAFSLESFSTVDALGVAIDGSVVRVTNLTSGPLADCRFGEGFSRSDVGTLAHGQTVEAAVSGNITGPIFNCLLPELPVAFRESDRRVRVQGVTRVFAYKP